MQKHHDMLSCNKIVFINVLTHHTHIDSDNFIIMIPLIFRNCIFQTIFRKSYEIFQYLICSLLNV